MMELAFKDLSVIYLKWNLQRIVVKRQFDDVQLVVNTVTILIERDWTGQTVHFYLYTIIAIQ